MESINKFTANKLKGRIVELYGNVKNYAQATQGNYDAINSKLRGDRKITREDIVFFCSTLDIKGNEIEAYFF